MISCQAFRATLQPGSEDPKILAHVRSCDACLDYAVSVDPDLFFRSIGGEEMVPPGGIDEFVGDVMAQVRLRQTETTATPRLPLNRYLRAAAAVLFVIAGTTGIYRYEAVVTGPASVTASMPARTASRVLTTKAVVETYQSSNATIVELPVASANDAKVIMIYDESLPADL